MNNIFDIVTLSDIDNIKASHWLIDDIIQLNSMSIIYGQPGCGKTFMVLDMCLHMAHNDNWKGHKINNKGIIIYCIGEGIHGICNRIKTWHHYNNKSNDAPFILIPIETISFSDKENIDKMIKTLDSIIDKYKLPISMIVVDTLSKASVGYDENSSKDMGEFLYQFDILKKYFELSILFIHHSNKNYRGIRGSSYLMGTADTVISITNNNNNLKCMIEKQKDGYKGEFLLKMCKYGSSLVIKNKDIKMIKDDCIFEIISKISEDELNKLILKGLTLETISKEYKQDLNYLIKINSRLELKK
jgi:putative DNA primase/helicase